MLNRTVKTQAEQFDVIVLGAGAAGLMCAATAAARGRRVAVVDHNQQPGRKILISGGGRANFTNLHCTAANYISENRHFAKSALALYTQQHFIELVNRYGIAWHEKSLGQLFCDNSARELLDMLLEECARGKVEMRLDRRVDGVERDGEGFAVATHRGMLTAGALVVATGGLSIPRIGATGIGYDIARQFGLRIVETRPALVPLTLGNAEATWCELAGVAAEVTVETGNKKRGRQSFQEKMLVTHRGLSGPAILQASSYWRQGEEISIDLLPGLSATERVLGAMQQPRARRDDATLRQLLRAHLPQRLANHVADQFAGRGWSNAEIEQREQTLRRLTLHPSGTEGYEKAEVTAGGVSTADLDARTLGARNVSGLFFIGEVVDVTGQLGGFNFQWAWSSAVAAGRAV